MMPSDIQSRPEERSNRPPDPMARRHPLVKAILARLQVMQPMLVVGDPFGGRSLLIETVIHPQVIRENKYDPDDFVIAWITSADILNCSVESFWLELVLPQFREELGRLDMSQAGQIRECEAQGVPFGVDEALYLIRKKFRRKPLIAWDGFEVVPGNGNLDKGFFAQLRAHSQTYELNFLIGSSKPFEDFPLWTVSTSPFFNIFYSVDMDKARWAL
jgi:hypothetical protein